MSAQCTHSSTFSCHSSRNSISIVDFIRLVSRIGYDVRARALSRISEMPRAPASAMACASRVQYVIGTAVLPFAAASKGNSSPYRRAKTPDAACWRQQPRTCSLRACMCSLLACPIILSSAIYTSHTHTYVRSPPLLARETHHHHHHHLLISPLPQNGNGHNPESRRC